MIGLVADPWVIRKSMYRPKIIFRLGEALIILILKWILHDITQHVHTPTSEPFQRSHGRVGVHIDHLRWANPLESVPLAYFLPSQDTGTIGKLATGDLQWFPTLAGLFFASGSVKVVQSPHDHKLPWNHHMLELPPGSDWNSFKIPTMETGVMSVYTNVDWWPLPNLEGPSIDEHCTSLSRSVTTLPL